MIPALNGLSWARWYGIKTGSRTHIARQTPFFDYRSICGMVLFTSDCIGRNPTAAYPPCQECLDILIGDGDKVHE